MKLVTILCAGLLVALTTFGQTVDTPDDAARLAEIRALTPTTEAQSNWVAETEAQVLTRLGDEEQAVAAARRISEPDFAALTESWVRLYSSNYSKVIEIGDAWLAKPQSDLQDIYRLKLADHVTEAMKASGGELARKDRRVRVVTGALTNIAQTIHEDFMPLPRIIVRQVNFVRRAGAPDASQAEMIRHLVRITPVNRHTVKTLGDWKGWLTWHGSTNVVLSDVVLGTNLPALVDVYAADAVTRGIESGGVAAGPTRTNCVNLLTRALAGIDSATLTNLGFTAGGPVPRLVVRLAKFVKAEGPPDTEREAMLRHLIQMTPVTEKTLKTVGEWKGWLARQGYSDVVLNDVVEGTNTLQLVEIYATHAERNIPQPYANSVFGEAYRRGDVAAMRRYLDLFPK